MSRDTVDSWSLLGLVVAGGVEGEPAEQLAGVVEDPDVSPGDEHGDGLAGVATAHADVVEVSGVADGELAVAVDGVASDAVAVDGDGGQLGVGFGAGGEGFEGSAPADGPVGPGRVVGVGEAVEVMLQSSSAADGSLFGEEAFQGLVEPLDAPMFVKRRERRTLFVVGGVRRRLLWRCSA